MTMAAPIVLSERPCDAAVFTGAADIAGGRHEVLPPRRITQPNGRGSLVRSASRAGPP
ncbi:MULTISPECIES: hypothetical protein [Microbacterium]|uniref:hypothetical protein n=1 Tax=Microbacterium TaxID=33882 RepID=UPI001EF56B0C|nr:MULTISPECIES: hypothetical protein [Microbacterium]MCG7414456.1 hypothetical protein [Microbacterium aurum]